MEWGGWPSCGEVALGLRMVALGLLFFFSPLLLPVSSSSVCFCSVLFSFSSLVSIGGGAAIDSGSRCFLWRWWGRQAVAVLLSSALFSLFSRFCISKQIVFVFQSSLSSFSLYPPPSHLYPPVFIRRKGGGRGLLPLSSHGTGEGWPGDH